MSVKKKVSKPVKKTAKPAAKPVKYAAPKQSSHIVDQAQKLKDVMSRITSVGNM